MNKFIPIKEYEEAVYIYWFGPNTPSVKIGHSSDPDKRLKQLGNDSGVPDHLASFAAIVWLDRKREKVESKAHELAAKWRKSGEWFELTASEALKFIVAAADELNIRYEVEDRVGGLLASKEELALKATREAEAKAREKAYQQERYWKAHPEERARLQQARAEADAKFLASSVAYWNRKFEERPFGDQGFTGNLSNSSKE